MKIKRSNLDYFASFCIYLLLFAFAFIILLPFYNMLILSFSTFADAARPGLNLIPRNLTVHNYIRIFEEGTVPNAMLISVFNVVMGTFMALIMTIIASYVLSRKNLPFRKPLFYICIFTMYFSAGLLPWYLVLLNLGFAGSIWVMTVPSILSTFNMILMRNYFFTLPDALEESAKLDGAGDLRIMWQIIVPLSKPILATISLFYAVAFWNEWFNAMLFIREQSLVPLQLLLRRMVLEALIDLRIPEAAAARADNIQFHSRSIGMAATMVATVPILFAYPFLQKYFTKGLVLGAIKA